MDYFRYMKRYIYLILFFLALALPAFSFALSLEQAKSKGQIGEQLDGYLGIVVSSPEVQDLVSRVNQERRTKYTQIATKNGTELKIVETLAGKKAIDNTAPGQFIKLSSGQWSRK